MLADHVAAGCRHVRLVRGRRHWVWHTRVDPRRRSCPCLADPSTCFTPRKAVLVRSNNRRSVPAGVAASRTIEIPVGCTRKVPLAVKTARQARMTLILKGRSALSQPGSQTGVDHDDRD